MNWKVSKFKGGRKWVCWAMTAWVTYREGEPVHVGFGGQYLGTWEIPPERARSILEEMYAKTLMNNYP